MGYDVNKLDLAKSILIIDKDNDKRQRQFLIDIVDKCLDLSNAEPVLQSDIFEFLEVITSNYLITSLIVSDASVNEYNIYFNVSGDIKNMGINTRIADILLQREALLVCQ